jgi:hypothetical protein
MVGPFGTPQGLPGSEGGAFSSVAVGPSGQVLVTYQVPVAPGGPSHIFVNLEPVGSARFGQPVLATASNVGTHTLLPAQPDHGINAGAALAWDRGGAHAGRVYLAYVDRPAVASDDTDIFVRSSDDDGTTWGDPLRVNDDPSRFVRSKFNPALAVDQGTGNVAVTWYDAREDDGSPVLPYNDNVPNTEVRVYGTISYDGGLHFAPNVPISTGVSSGPAAGAYNLGGYDTMDFAGGVFYRVWADNSVGPGALDGNPGPGRATDLATARVAVTSLISGYKFNDLDGDGVWDRDREPPLSGWTIFVDLNHSGRWEPGDPYAVTDARGSYCISGLPPATYVVREVQRPGWVQTAPAGGSYSVTIANPTDRVTDLDFGNHCYLDDPGSISGTKYEDLDGSGWIQGFDPPLNGWSIFLDPDDDGTWCPGDPIQSTGADGTDGHYSFGCLPADVYHVYEQQKYGWVQTLPGGGRTVTLLPSVDATGCDFLNAIADTGPDNGYWDAGGLGLGGRTVFPDPNNNGVPDRYDVNRAATATPPPVPDGGRATSGLAVDGLAGPPGIDAPLVPARHPADPWARPSAGRTPPTEEGGGRPTAPGRTLSSPPPPPGSRQNYSHKSCPSGRRVAMTSVGRNRYRSTREAARARSLLLPEGGGIRVCLAAVPTP